MNKNVENPVCYIFAKPVDNLLYTVRLRFALVYILPRYFIGYKKSHYNS